MSDLSACKRLFSMVAATVFLVSATIPGRGQTSGVGNISGTVTDNSGAIVAGATVTVINTDKGVTRTLTTDAAGNYQATFLQPGHYEVILGGESFGKVDRTNLLLTVGQTLTVDAALPPASASTQVVVTSDTPILDTEKTETSQTIGQQLISNLPVNTRNWSAFVLNTPNVAPDGGSGLVSFRGISGLYNQNYVDGANNNQMLFSEARGRASGAPYVYSLDSIKEFQAETSNYSVEFGQAAGGQVNAITKSGTNVIHGDLFYYLRYPSLNALDPQTKWSALHNTSNAQAAAFLLTQPVHQQQQFGGSVGGPIIKDRLFYFFTYDGFRRVGKALYYNNNVVTLTPTPDSSGTVISPAQCPTTITSAQCNAAVQFILDNGFGAPSRNSRQNIFFPRIDWHINSKNDMFVNFNWANFDSTYGYNGSNTFSGSSPSTNGPTSYHERFLVAGLTSQISDRSINQVHFQYGRDLETAGANAAGPSVGIGTFTYGMPNALPRTAEPDEHRTQITDVFSTTRGHHSFKFGGDVNIVHEVMINLFQGGGIYNYSGTNNQINFQNWAADSFRGQPGDTDPLAGYHFTSFVQTVDQLNPAAKAGLDDFWMKMLDAFAEDSWKIHPNLTLTLGIRWDLQITPPPVQNNTNFPPISTLYSSTIKNTDRFQPRVALAWTPFDGTVVRAGYGLFSGLNQGSTYYAMRVENGVVQVNYNFTGCGSTCTPSSAAKVGLQFPNVPFLPPGPSLSSAIIPSGAAQPQVSGSGTLGSQSFHGLDPNFVPPYAHEAELGVEQLLPGKMTLSVGYVGTRGMRLPIFVDANLRGQTPTGARTYNVVDSNGNLQQQLTVPVYRVQDRIVPTLQSYNTGFSVANTWYNSLAVSVRRPFSNGLELLANYTWAHSTDTGQVQGSSGTFYGGDTPLDPNRSNLDNGNSDTDIRNRFVMSFVYQPKIMQENVWVKHILDDFLFSGSFTASGGQPIFMGMSGTVFNGGSGSYGSGGNIYGGAISSSSGFATTGRPPQIARNSIYAPGYNNLDFRISRDVPIHDNIKLQFVGEAFNLLNHRIITGVNGTHSQYAAAASSGACNVATQVPGTAEAPLQGCIAPYSGKGSSAFGAVSSTSNSLYGPRQLQVAAKFFF
ncbi:TonB-dependent receptor [Edaphobacter sp. 12200R-103]|uniref:TonB-dependent receptor n=1 Tax=Edaphobacter sp. 12200R-103 TaxID=2703788 RepID=UPI00138D4BA9|nr:carboxypeptidase regulatory-like domain-containing protein [Edaphobacter sp. 12200R-103]QHS51985.1 TonB-dependent receptor [Edaphobacter sp. 12200R-103]